jgi:hypothetical protein
MAITSLKYRIAENVDSGFGVAGKLRRSLSDDLQRNFKAPSHPPAAEK